MVGKIGFAAFLACFALGADFSFTNLVMKGSIRLSEVKGLKLHEAKAYRPFKSTYGF